MVGIMGGSASHASVTAPAAETLRDLLRQFEERGEAVAIVAFGEGDAGTRTFGELVRTARRIAARIGKERAGGSTVGLMAANGPTWVEGFWGIVAAGMTVMPIDIQASNEELRSMIEKGACHLVLADAQRIERLRRIVPECTTISLETAREESEEGITPGGSAETAVLAFTSGTTGTPKAVPLSHANLLSNVQALLAERIVGPDDRALIPLPLHHAYPLTAGMLTVLAAGATMVFPEGLSGPQLVAALHEGRVTALVGVPRLYAALVAGVYAEAARRGGRGARLFPVLLAAASFCRRRLGLPVGRPLFRAVRQRVGSELRLLVSGGAALSFEVEAALLGLGFEVLTGYGLTETSPILTFNRAGRSRIGCAGEPLPGVRLRIAHADSEGVGEIEATGSSVFSGYRDDPAASETTFTPDGWFRTGDLGRLDTGGRLFIMARAKETIVLSSGKKVDPESIEAAYGGDPVIREIAVFGRDDRLVAVVVPDEEAIRRAGAFRPEGLIRDALQTKARTLPSYLRLAGFAVTRQPLPRTQLGKLRRHQLPQLFGDAGKAKRATPEAPAVASSAGVQVEDPRAKAIWNWLGTRYPGRALDLETSPQLDLGIDSLEWVELTLALQREFGIALAQEQIARIVTMGDLLREAVAAPAVAGAQEAAKRETLWPEPYGMGVRLLRLGGEFLVRASMRGLFRLRVEGRGALPRPPFLLCPNHLSYLDPFALGAALPHRVLSETWWAGWTGLLFSSALRRLFSRAAQVIPIDPDRAAGAAVDLGVAALSRGHVLVWFAEGGLSPDGSLQPFRPGVGAVLARRSVPVVPALVTGSDEALPPGKHVPLPHRIVVRFGTVIDPSTIAPELEPQLRESRIAEALHEAVARLRPEANAGRGSGS